MSSLTQPADPPHRTITAKPALLALALALTGIGALAFAVSYVSVRNAAHPVFGALAWAAPVLLDTTIAVLIGLGIVLELNALSGRIPRAVARALVALTIYANVAPAHGLYARLLHATAPAVWVACVAIAENAVRKLVKLTSTTRSETVSRALWVLRPAATWRIWRTMRIHQITTYRGAADREAARTAVRGRLRLHYGPLWRWRAPLAERVALRLEGRDPHAVATILTVHCETVTLLAALPAPAAPPRASVTLPAASDHSAPAPPGAPRPGAPRSAPRTTAYGPALRPAPHSAPRATPEAAQSTTALECLTAAETRALALLTAAWAPRIPSQGAIRDALPADPDGRRCGASRATRLQKALMARAEHPDWPDPLTDALDTDLAAHTP